MVKPESELVKKLVEKSQPTFSELKMNKEILVAVIFEVTEATQSRLMGQYIFLNIHFYHNLSMLLCIKSKFSKKNV